MRMLIGVVFVVSAVTLVCTSGSFGGDEKPKYTIKVVMKDAHKGGLLTKVAKGEADEAEKKKLVEYYKALSQCKSPAGEDADWKKKTETLLKLAEASVKGEDVGAKLQKAANCKACHEIHKK
jgi:hypothetical protein